jgi:hypothetical protein
MPEEAARALARVLHGRGEEVRSANGALPASTLEPVPVPVEERRSLDSGVR